MVHFLGYHHSWYPKFMDLEVYNMYMTHRNWIKQMWIGNIYMWQSYIHAGSLNSHRPAHNNHRSAHCRMSMTQHGSASTDLCTRGSRRPLRANFGVCWGAHAWGPFRERCRSHLAAHAQLDGYVPGLVCCLAAIPAEHVMRLPVCIPAKNINIWGCPKRDKSYGVHTSYISLSLSLCLCLPISL